MPSFYSLIAATTFAAPSHKTSHGKGMIWGVKWVAWVSCLAVTKKKGDGPCERVSNLRAQERS